MRAATPGTGTFGAHLLTLVEQLLTDERLVAASDGLFGRALLLALIAGFTQIEAVLEQVGDGIFTEGITAELAVGAVAITRQ